MELLAFAAIAFIVITGWVLLKTFCNGLLSPLDKFYFAPAAGIGVIGCFAFAMSWRNHTSHVLIFVAVVFVALIVHLLRMQPVAAVTKQEWQLACYSIFAFLCVFAMQLSVYLLFAAAQPRAHGVWTVYHATGTAPPDQMFYWHQAMFAARHSHYPGDSFYQDFDLYDRPHLAGYVVLFFFQLFRLPLTESHWAYPADALRFYHCLCWLINNFYLFGVAALFKRVLGYSGALIAVALTAATPFFLLCNLGSWMKFASAYPFLLAMALFVEGNAPVVQAMLCSAGFYIHSSVLPFLFGFGLLQLTTVGSFTRIDWNKLKNVAWFGAIVLLVVGAWFIRIRAVGSKQPLLYYYIYDAPIAAAQTQPVPQLARAFYANNSWSKVSLLPVQNFTSSILPLPFILDLIYTNVPFRVSDLASAVFDRERMTVTCATGLVLFPLVLYGLLQLLRQRQASRVAFALYLVPSLLMALLYRKHAVFSLHIMTLYHALVLFVCVYCVKQLRFRLTYAAVCLVGLEGLFCIIFADRRFSPVRGIQLNHLPMAGVQLLLTYGGLLLAFLTCTYVALKRCKAQATIAEEAVTPLTRVDLSVVARKLCVAFVCAAVVFATYALYCRRFY